MITAHPTDVLLLRDKLVELRWRKRVLDPQRRADMAMHRAHGRIARDVRARKVVYLRDRV